MSNDIQFGTGRPPGDQPGHDHDTPPGRRHEPAGPLIADALRLSAATFTAAPARPRTLDRSRGTIAIALAPYFGLALGALAGLLVVGLYPHVFHDPDFLTGTVTILVVAAIVVTLLAAATGGLHLAALAGTADALAAGERVGGHDGDGAAPAGTRSQTGGRGMAAIVLLLIIQVACVARLALMVKVNVAATTVSYGTTWRIVAALAAAWGTGRLAAALACRKGVPSADREGLSALFAGSLGWLELAFGLVVVGAVSIYVVPGRAWQGPVVVLVALAATLALTEVARRRLGGVTLRFLGACIELATTLCLVGFLIHWPY